MLQLFKPLARIVVALLWAPISFLKTWCIFGVLAGLLWGSIFAAEHQRSDALIFFASALVASWAWWGLRLLHLGMRRAVRR